MSIGADGTMIVADVRGEQQPPGANTVTHVIKVRVDDVGAQFERARAVGATVLEPPTDREYGERELQLWKTWPAIAGNSPKHCAMLAPKSTDARLSRSGRTVLMAANQTTSFTGLSRLTARRVSDAATTCAR
jgi:hypothetical protein